jgi:tetratricopeptide (TPR) repeat protein
MSLAVPPRPAAGPPSQVPPKPAPAGEGLPPPPPKPRSTKVVASLHNIVNIPGEAKLSRDAGPFTVKLTGSSPAYAPLSHKFRASDILETDDARFEIKFNEVAVEWDMPYDLNLEIGVQVEVLEDPNRSLGKGTSSTVGQGTVSETLFPLRVSLKDVLERKLVTRIIGTPFGQIVVSLRPSPNDIEGYTYRLDAFLRHHNPESLPKMGRVVKEVTELATFTKLFKKYGVVNYKARAIAFYTMYGPEHLSALGQALDEWSGKEELFLQSLILDNGPEPCDIDLRKRLLAFAEHHNLGLQIDSLVSMHRESSDVLFAELVQTHGPEPDPRTYMFPPTTYTPKAQAARAAATPPAGPLTTSATSGDFRSENSVAPSGSVVVAPPAQRPPGKSRLVEAPIDPPVTAAPPPQNAVQRVGSGDFSTKTPPAQTIQPPPPAAAKTVSTPPSATIGSPQAARPQPPAPQPPQPNRTPGTAASAQQQTPTHGMPASESLVRRATAAGILQNQERYTAVPNNNPGAIPELFRGAGGVGTYKNILELWGNFIQELRSKGVPPTELYYISEDVFSQIIGELRYDTFSSVQLTHEWERRVSAALRIDYATPGDSLSETAKRDIMNLAGVSSLAIQVAGVTSLSNAEHETAYAMRLSQAKLRVSERLLYIGDHATLMEIALRGFAPEPGRGTVMGFYKKPFSQFDKPTTVSALLCDVVVGKSLVTVMDAPPLQPEFWDTYDSVVSFVNTEKQQVVVYAPQQVLPRFLVHVTYDPSVIPCPSHPQRPVEYFVVESGTFACSQCVVMGPYRGKEVITVEEAAVRAKTEILELTRSANALAAQVNEEDQQIQRQLQMLTASESRQQALREAEMIRKEAERRAAEILQAAESEIQMMQSELTEEQKEIGSVREDLSSVSQKLDRAVHGANPIRTLEILSQAREANELDRIRNRFVAASSRANSRSNSQAIGLSSASGMGLGHRSTPQPQDLGVSAIGSGTPSMAVGEGNGPQDEMLNKFLAAKRATLHPLTQSKPAGTAPSPGASTFQSSLPNLTSAFNSSALNRVGPQTATPQRTFGGATGALSLQSQSYTYPGGGGGGATPRTLHANPVQSSSTFRDAETKEFMKRGWAAYRSGDREGAQQIWMTIYERHQHEAVGARARAYVAEAIEKDYNGAASWYEKALRIDPSDYMTLFNYGVLLESVLGKKREALTFFEAAARLGDTTAQRRAEALRQQLGIF